MTKLLKHASVCERGVCVSCVWKTEEGERERKTERREKERGERERQSGGEGH